MLIDLTVDDELTELRSVVRDFLRTRLVPLEAALERDGELPNETWAEIEEAARALGFHALGIPADKGGGGLGIMGQVLVAEEMGHVSVGFRHVIGTPAGSQAIVRFGTSEQIDKYLTPWLAGKRWGAWTATEPDAGSDLGGMRTAAVREGDGWRISGSKHFITSVDRADFLIVFAKTSPERGIRGMTAYFVDKRAPGVMIGPEQAMMGRGGLHSFPVYLQDVLVSDDDRLGEVDSGIQVLMSNVGELRLLVAAHCVGVATRLVGIAQDWAAKREQFGVAIRNFGQLQGYLADVVPRILACRVAVYHAADRIAQGIGVREDTTIVKAQCAELAFDVADRVMQILGGYGYSKDMPVEALFRATRLWQIAEGSSEIQRLLIWRALDSGWSPRLDVGAE
jgi:hypothetical protein